jgi:prevent-host-death family protein
MRHPNQTRDVALTIDAMSPQDQELKNDVGVRELRDNLSRYVDHVADGNEIAITVRGKVVARMIPASPDEPFAELRRMGALREATKPLSSIPIPDEPQLKPGAGPISPDFVREWR